MNRSSIWRRLALSWFVGGAALSAAIGMGQSPAAPPAPPKGPGAAEGRTFERLLRWDESKAMANRPAARPGRPARSGADKKTRDERRKGLADRLQASGIVTGQVVKEATIYDLQGKPVSLASLWKDKPLVLVSGSITCPIAVASCPSLAELQKQHGEQVQAAILYLREAHPATSGKAAPRTDSEGKLIAGHGAYPQPGSLDDRLKLATAFQKAYGGDAPVYVVGLEGSLMSRLGIGPNSALLIGRDGKVLAKQGWYDFEEMHREIAKHAPVPPQ